MVLPKLMKMNIFISGLCDNLQAEWYKLWDCLNDVYMACQVLSDLEEGIQTSSNFCQRNNCNNNCNCTDADGDMEMSLNVIIESKNLLKKDLEGWNGWC